MRYRPLGREGRSISALTLAVGDEPKRAGERTRMIYAALESGVNAFELRGAHLVETAAGLARAVSAVPREALAISLRLAPDPRHGSQPFTREWIIHAVERTLYAADLDRLDVLIFDLPGPGAFTEEARTAAVAAREAGRIGLIGVAGDSAALDMAVKLPEIDVLITPYNLRSGWPERNRLKAAAARGLVVMGEDYHPSVSRKRRGKTAPASERGGGLFGLGKRTAPLEQVGGYGFLDRVHGWTPDEVCLAYALTEPGLASVLIEAQDPRVIEGLAQCTERDIPVGLPAQIEMARFSAA